MPRPSTLIGLLCYAVLCGIVAFLVVLALGLAIIHFITTTDGQSYGNTVKGLAVLVGFLVAGYVFFTGRGGITPGAPRV